MSEKSYQKMAEGEISLKGVIDFFLEAWKIILTFSLLGLFGSIAYLLISSNHYEAFAQVQMAQIISNSNSNSNGNNANPLGVNVEEPTLLLARMRLPSSYSDKELKACGLENSKSPLENIADMVKFSTVKGAATIVELRIQMKTKVQAISCAQSIFEKIRDSQYKIIKPHIEEARSLLVKYETRLEDAKMIVVRADKSGSALSAAYLANRDEVKFLTDEIMRLNTFIMAGDTRQAKLVSPIYASDTPVFPKKKLSLMLGLTIGLFFGFILAIIKKYLQSIDESELIS